MNRFIDKVVTVIGALFDQPKPAPTIEVRDDAASLAEFYRYCHSDVDYMLGNEVIEFKVAPHSDRQVKVTLRNHETYGAHSYESTRRPPRPYVRKNEKTKVAALRRMLAESKRGWRAARNLREHEARIAGQMYASIERTYYPLKPRFANTGSGRSLYRTNERQFTAMFAESMRMLYDHCSPAAKGMRDLSLAFANAGSSIIHAQVAYMAASERMQAISINDRHIGRGVLHFDFAGGQIESSVELMGRLSGVEIVPSVVMQETVKMQGIDWNDIDLKYLNPIKRPNVIDPDAI
jgi:hypothetical protein